MIAVIHYELTRTQITQLHVDSNFPLAQIYPDNSNWVKTSVDQRQSVRTQLIDVLTLNHDSYEGDNTSKFPPKFQYVDDLSIQDQF